MKDFKLRQISKTSLYLLFGLTPALMIDGWGNSYTEPKLVAVILLSVICAVDLIHRLVRGAGVRITPLILSLSLLSLISIMSANRALNPGTYLIALTLSISALILAIYCSETEIKLDELSRVITPVLILTQVGALSTILFRIPLFSEYSPFGSTIGLKNSLSAFLTQSIPFQLILMFGVIRSAGKRARWKEIALLGMVAVSVWVVLANRTRAAWCVLIFYGLALFAISLRSRSSEWRRLFAGYLLAGVTGLLLLLTIPNSLQWKSTTPYVDSLSTLASLENSSGRNLLWKVGFEIIKSHPWIGIGSGNYPVIWRDFIKKTDVDPTAFGFLRPDLPVFNDYLQYTIENGVPFGLIFFFVMALLPIYCLIRLLREDVVESGPELLACLLCVGTAMIAIFDYPFNRPEALLSFILALCLVYKRVAISTAVAIPRFEKIAFASLTIFTVFLFLTMAQMSVGLSSKALWLSRGRIANLKTALNWWPWDCQWSSYQLRALLSAGEIEAAERLIEHRRKAWPFDPESFLMAALFREKQGKLQEAVFLLYRAAVQTKGGHCYFPAHQAYKSITRRSDFPKDTVENEDIDVMDCLRYAQKILIRAPR